MKTLLPLKHHFSRPLAIGLAMLSAILCMPVADVFALPPGLGYVYPPAVPAGAETQVQLGGYDFTPDMQWFVHHDSVKLETDGVPGDFLDIPPPYWTGPRAGGASLPIPREVTARIHVPANLPAGLVRWQVANANGSSKTAMLYVSRSNEVLESRSRDFPQRLPDLPIAVSGRLSRLTEVDRYEIVARDSSLISVELMARRIGSDFQGIMEVHNATGQLLADLSDTQGLDGSLAFAAVAGETYTVSIRDADFRGDRSYVYRLAFTTGPRVVCVLPAQGQRGTSAEVTLIGYGLADGKPELQRVKQTVAFAADPALDKIAVPIATPAGATSIDVPLSDQREATLADADLKQESANSWKTNAPIAVTAQLPPDVEEHRYVWHAEKDQFWKISLLSQAVGGRLDVSATVLDPAGKVVSEVDDFGGTSDASLEFRAAESGDFCCVVRSLSMPTGSLDEIYRLELTQPQPAFSLTVPQQVSIPSGGKAEVTIQATRSGGLDGEIAIVVQGLPEGVSTEGSCVIPGGKNDAKLTLQASSAAAVKAGMLTVQGTANNGDATVTQTATAVAGGNLSPQSPDDTRVTRVMAAVTMTAPFDVLIVDRDRQHEVSRGTTFLADVEIVRKPITEGAAPFDGPIRLESTANQQRYRAGIRSTFVEVPATASKVQFPCFMPEWLATDLTQRMLIHGVAVVPDPKGNLRHITKPGDARITMIMEGALLKLSTSAKDVVARPGQTVEIPVSILRSPTFQLPATIELSAPEEAANWITAEALVLSPEASEGILKISTTADDRLRGAWTLTLKATSLQQGRWPVISEVELPIEFTP